MNEISSIHTKYRTEAFAAIRRAAEIAREEDSECAIEHNLGNTVISEIAFQRGSAIREAIRAAIGSEKQ